jgi:putative DNA primase/helicase
MPVTAIGRTEEETEKRLGALMMAGQPLISIDNANGEVGGDALCQYLEQPAVNIRVLGLSKMPTVETRGTTFFMNGNNITLRGDVVRRVITTIIDPKVERPELRKFKKNPREMVLADRGKYIAAALTICKAYVVAGRPFQVDPLASYEGWSNTVRSALMWLGEADPVASIDASREEDPERIRRKNMLAAWIDAIGIGSDCTCTIGRAVRIANKQINPGTPQFPELRDAMTAAASRKGSNIDPDDAIDNEALGKWLRINKGKIENGLRFANKSDQGRGARWYVEHIDGVEAEKQYKADRAKQKASDTEIPF